MNARIYESIIKNGLKTLGKGNLSDVAAILKNCGVEFPKGDLATVREVLSSDDFTSWRKISKEDAQSSANDGIATLAIDETSVYVIAPESEDGESIEGSVVAFASDVNENAEFFSYRATSSSVSTLDRLKGKFPHGKYWNHVGSSANNPDGYTSSPCPSHSPSSTCNTFQIGNDSASQCSGFAFKCGAEATGTNSFLWENLTDSSAINSLKPGDIVRYKTSSDGRHSIYVTHVNGSTVKYGDCNGAGSSNYCQIRWDNSTTKTKLKTKFKSMRKAPVTLDT